jgi:hypothetical protein
MRDKTAQLLTHMFQAKKSQPKKAYTVANILSKAI